ncbi:hypothetical protein CISG_07919 [Coccidioides immitis RMSCC 3703]|uniref:Uncharacterized protein n=1 Tax=Coccidioides immitis RMSCC 3703 TaxID=454286 RepID=A0A0J8U0Q4_COCIT|nr:hypothetical protein CISG_07919 [Coccidioides immitis RMSCC 3703]
MEGDMWKSSSGGIAEVEEEQRQQQQRRRRRQQGEGGGGGGGGGAAGRRSSWVEASHGKLNSINMESESKQVERCSSEQQRQREAAAGKQQLARKDAKIEKTRVNSRKSKEAARQPIGDPPAGRQQASPLSKPQARG